VNKKKALFEFAFTLIGVCLLGIASFFWMQVYEPIPPEPYDQHVESVDAITYEGNKRSGEWQSLRKRFVESYPRCKACGSTLDLNVHHIEPFHMRPELELEWSNLITLCREHHFKIGHDPDGPWRWKRPSWSLSNPNVRQDAEKWMKAHTMSRR
jgi:5-methylcytosine-specific restriction endonuclease McrA